MSHSLDQLRGRIALIDTELIVLLKERMLVSQEIGLYKKRNGMAIHDPVQEAVVLSRIIEKAKESDLDPDIVRAVWMVLLDHSKQVQTPRG